MKRLEGESKPFLWGPVKSALLLDAQEYGTQMILDLCYSSEQCVIDMAIQVLTDLGRDAPTSVNAVLDILLPPQVEPGRVQRALQLIRKPQVTSDERTR